MAETYKDDDIVTINTLSEDDNPYDEDNIITIHTTGDDGAPDVEQAINTRASEAESTSVVGPAIDINDIEPVAENIITNCDAFIADLRWACSMRNTIDNYSIDKVEEAVTTIDAMYKILVAFCKTT